MWNKTLDALKGQAALIYTCILSYILGMYAYMYVLANTCHGLNGTITWMCHQGCELVATGNVTCSHACWIVSHADGAGGGEEAEFIEIVAANIFLKATFPAKAH